MDLVEVRGGLPLPPEVVLMRMGGNSSLPGKDLNRDAFARDSMPPQALPLYDPDVVARTGLTKSEQAEYLPQLVALLDHFPSLQKSALVGGLGSRIATNRGYRSQNPATDIDLFASSVDDSVRDSAREAQLTESRRRRFSGSNERVSEVVARDKPYFKVPIPGYDGQECDLFEGRIAYVSSPLELKHSSVRLGSEDGPTVYVANRGLLLATMLVNDSFVRHRGRRAKCLIQSVHEGNVFEDEIEDVRRDFVRTLQHNGLGKDDLTKAVAFAENDKWLRKQGTYRSFCQEVYNAL